jgi:hypothetical protein
VGDAADLVLNREQPLAGVGIDDVPEAVLVPKVVRALSPKLTVTVA